MLYKLTPQNIRDGYLTDDDISSGLGYHVTTFPLRSFPHSEALLRDKKLPPTQSKERADAIYKALRDKNLINYGNNFSVPSSGVFTYKDAQSLAQRESSSVRVHQVSLKFLDSPPWARHFSLITQYGFIKAHQFDELWIASNNPDFGETKQNVFPGILDEEIPVDSCCFKKAACMLVDRVSSSQYWSNILRMPAELLDTIPTDDCHILADQIHEKRHLHQIVIDSPSFAAIYYAELDADMATFASLQEAGIGTQTISAAKHARYTDLLFSSPSHWFAPVLDDTFTGRRPVNFFKVYDTVSEIRIRLGESLCKQPFSPISSEEMQYHIRIWNEETKEERQKNKHSAYISHIFETTFNQVNQCVGKNLAPIFSETRRLLEQNVFGDPFTQQVASNIVAAAHYFNPDLITADYEPSRKRLQDRLRSIPKASSG